MNKNEMLDAAFVASSCDDIKPVINVKSVVKSLVVLAVSIVLLVFSSRMDEDGSSLGILLLTLGVVGMIWFFYLLTCKRKALAYVPTGSCLEEGSCFFDMDNLEKVSNSLRTSVFDIWQELEMGKKGNARVSFIKSSDGNFVAVQLFRFIPYTFEPASDVFLFREADARRLAQYLK